MKPEPFLKLALAIKISNKRSIVVDSYSTRPSRVTPPVIVSSRLPYNK